MRPSSRLQNVLRDSLMISGNPHESRSLEALELTSRLPPRLRYPGRLIVDAHHSPTCGETLGHLQTSSLSTWRDRQDQSRPGMSAYPPHVYRQPQRQMASISLEHLTWVCSGQPMEEQSCSSHAYAAMRGGAKLTGLIGYLLLADHQSRPQAPKVQSAFLIFTLRLIFDSSEFGELHEFMMT